MNARKQTRVLPPKKRPYQAPKLIVHGNLRALTLAKGGTLGDGSGKPKTRTSSGPG